MIEPSYLRMQLLKGLQESLMIESSFISCVLALFFTDSEFVQSYSTLSVNLFFLVFAFVDSWGLKL